MTAEGVQAAAKAAKQLTLREAEMILGLESGATWADVMKVCVYRDVFRWCAVCCFRRGLCGSAAVGAPDIAALHVGRQGARAHSAAGGCCVRCSGGAVHVTALPLLLCPLCCAAVRAPDACMHASRGDVQLAVPHHLLASVCFRLRRSTST